MFGDKLHELLRMGLVRTDIVLPVENVFVANGVCNIFCRMPDSYIKEDRNLDSTVQWRTFNAT